jgi:hypothetical protein
MSEPKYDYNHDVNDPREAARFDEGKPKMELVPWGAIDAMARVFGFGLKKYGPWNWAKGFPWLQPYASLMRHLKAWHEGEDYDQESGLSHLDHAIANIAMLIEFRDRGTGTDNRRHVVEAGWEKERKALEGRERCLHCAHWLGDACNLKKEPESGQCGSFEGKG